MTSIYWHVMTGIVRESAQGGGTREDRSTIILVVPGFEPWPLVCQARAFSIELCLSGSLDNLMIDGRGKKSKLKRLYLLKMALLIPDVSLLHF